MSLSQRGTLGFYFPRGLDEILFLSPSWVLSQLPIRPSASWAIDSEPIRARGKIVKDVWCIVSL